MPSDTIPEQLILRMVSVARGSLETIPPMTSFTQAKAWLWRVYPAFKQAGQFWTTGKFTYVGWAAWMEAVKDALTPPAGIEVEPPPSELGSEKNYGTGKFPAALFDAALEIARNERKDGRPIVALRVARITLGNAKWSPEDVERSEGYFARLLRPELVKAGLLPDSKAVNP